VQSLSKNLRDDPLAAAPQGQYTGIENKMTNKITRIAMWSGPRNISTAMMRSWENRGDTFVSDEPFYACYLQSTGLQHPGRDAVIASQPTDWRDVAAQCTRDRQEGCSVHYQKHMTHHILPEFELHWLDELVNVFLIRSPREVVASYAKARPDLTAADVGFEQQHRLFKHVVNRIDNNPLVVSATDILANPALALQAICTKAGIGFDPRMLKWPPGPRQSDGVWAPYWYEQVQQSTGFKASPARDVALTVKQSQVVEQCQPYYNSMLAYCLQHQ